jgi:polar amino acid transport system permease protein
MLKTTSLASVITVAELLFAAQGIYSSNFRVVPLLIVGSVWYAGCTSVLYVGQYYLERYYGRGRSGEESEAFAARVVRGLLSFPRRGEHFRPAGGEHR